MRKNIHIPLDLHKKMKAEERYGKINWSAVAQAAFSSVIESRKYNRRVKRGKIILTNTPTRRTPNT